MRALASRQGHEAVNGDLDDAERLVAAFEGCDRLFLLSPAHPDQAGREKALRSPRTLRPGRSSS